MALLFLLCDTLTTSQLKKEQTIISCHQFVSVFCNCLLIWTKYLLDYSCGNDEAYDIAEEISSKLRVGIITKLSDGFLDGLREHTFGNILCEKVDAYGQSES